MLADLLSKLPKSCQNVSLETGVADRGDWEAEAQRSATAQRHFHEVLHKVMCSVRNFRVSVRAFSNDILGWVLPYAHLRSSTLRELVVVVEEHSNMAAQGQYPLRFLRSADFRSCFPSLERCVVVQRVENNRCRYIDDQYDSYMIRDILHRRSVCLALM